MSQYPGLFAIKLKEMEKAYLHLQCRLEVCQQESYENIHREVEQAKTDEMEYDVLLKKAVQGSRTPLVSQLAQAQLTYNQTARSLLDAAAGEGKSPDEQAEAAAVYAEFAIDRAVYGMNHALHAAMIAMEKQHIADETNREERK